MRLEVIRVEAAVARLEVKVRVVHITTLQCAHLLSTDRCSSTF